MRRPSLRIVVFAIAINLPASGQAQEQAGEAEGQPTTQQQPSQTFPLPLPVDIVEDEATAQAREREEKEARQREIADLAAQEGMNAATQAMNDATQRMPEYAFWSTLLVGIGTVLLIITLYQTRQANRAAQSAVAVTREIGEAQVRAYAAVKAVRLIIRKDGNGIMAEEVVVIENTGMTPAIITRVHRDSRAAFVSPAGEHIRWGLPGATEPTEIIVNPHACYELRRGYGGVDPEFEGPLYLSINVAFSYLYLDEKEAIEVSSWSHPNIEDGEIPWDEPLDLTPGRRRPGKEEDLSRYEE